MRVGFIGLGTMGLPMSMNLVKAGVPLMVFNRTPGRAGDVVALGAKPAESVAALVQGVDLVLTCLGTLAATDEVFRGPQGVLAHTRPGQILVDHSTIAPNTARSLAAEAAGRSARFLDAPVSGGPEGARAATLTIMVGGDADAYAVAEPTLRGMGQRVQRVGPSGGGCIFKLVNQALTAIHAAAAAEAMTLGAKAGADAETLFRILKASFGQSRMLERSVPRFIARDFSPATRMKRISQDLELVSELGRECGVSLPLAEKAADLCNEALSMGLGESDLAAYVLPYEREAAVIVA
jgi:3-hydroxyisobutyrate dehydrogenase-like beta-hydroxyacid dehydrogenase